MSAQDSTAISMNAVEALMLDKFETEPFHNLRLLYGEGLWKAVPGGTCSDKTLSFLSAAERAGFNVALHSAFIGGQEIHRLARVQVAGRAFFADVGNGWPALKLYPSDREVSFRCFGMGFRTEINGERLCVFHERRGRESLQLEIDVRGRPERDIRADIERRFDSGIVYPFSHSLRFSLVVGRRFLFLRGDRLEIYSDSSFDEVVGIQPEDLSSVLIHYFGYAIGALFRPSIERGNYDIRMNSLNEAARRALEEMMKGYEYQSDFAKKYVAQGRVEEAARALLTVLRLRGIALSEDERAQILIQNDPSVLERWHERAVVASSIAEVFQMAH